MSSFRRAFSPSSPIRPSLCPSYAVQPMSFPSSKERPHSEYYCCSMYSISVAPNSTFPNHCYVKSMEEMPCTDGWERGVQRRGERAATRRCGQTIRPYQLLPCRLLLVGIDCKYLGCSLFWWPSDSRPQSSCPANASGLRFMHQGEFWPNYNLLLVA